MKRKSRKRRKPQGSRRRLLPWVLGLLLLAGAGAVVYFYDSGALPWRQISPPGRPVANDEELQIALARLAFSPGPIDGKPGGQTKLAIEAFQESRGLAVTGELDPATRKALRIVPPVHAYFELTAAALRRLTPPPASWRARGEMDFLGYHSVLEMVAERSAAHPEYIRRLNPSLNWEALRTGDRILVPHVPPVRLAEPVASIDILLAKRQLRAFDDSGDLMFHAPVSIAREVEKRPVGQLQVKVRVANPNYTFNPNILTAAAEREGITEKFIIQPGPNNPVGTVWLGLNRPSYGIHGTPAPEQVGRTESSGCFRLANWNAETLLHATAVGTPVRVLP